MQMRSLGSIRGSAQSLHNYRAPNLRIIRFLQCSARFATKQAENDHRSRLSRFWAPSGGIAASLGEDGQSKLIRAGFLRQAHSGLFHFLPLGLRVQQKIEALIDRHMSGLGASKVDLSSISSAKLWRESGRLRKAGSELFQFTDRKGFEYLLSPTHEEEITCLVASCIKSYKELPLRLYQISRKYRDELRPRHGLLRSREFVMKDLYTFDCALDDALVTYEQVRQAYSSIFNELKLPYLVAEADSGDMGGNLSHEYHFPSPQGEDHIVTCTSCGYAANEELAKASRSLIEDQSDSSWVYHDGESTIGQSCDAQIGTPKFSVWRGITKDRLALVNVWYATEHGLPSKPGMVETSQINIHAVKDVSPDLDSSIDDGAALWLGGGSNHEFVTAGTLSITNLIDHRLPSSVVSQISVDDSRLPVVPASFTGSEKRLSISTILTHPMSNDPLNLVRIQNGDACGRCHTGSLFFQRAIELGHTFHLGTRYSDPLDASIAIPVEYAEADSPSVSKASLTTAPIQMGCHGIGISRMIGAVAESLADQKGLNWPRVIAPFEAVIIPTRDCEFEAGHVYDAVVGTSQEQVSASPGVDAVVDDRRHPFPWKMHDADLVGYPVIIVVGRAWKQERMCQVQCRRLGVEEDVPFNSLLDVVKSLLTQL